jgi:DNA helicase-2/ATP-dependent DNA helicase PcrA
MTDFTPRASQQEILNYQGGHLGISAVPGSGKTHTLSALAAEIIASGVLGRDQEVLIVTLVNSAVDNFASRIDGFIQQRGLIPQLGYRVRTLHGLAHDIVREKPARVGLEERFQIIDEQEANRIRADAVHAWLQTHARDFDEYLDLTMDENKLQFVRRKHLPVVAEEIALAFIRSAKNASLTPEKLDLLLQRSPIHLPLASMGLAVYADYQRALHYRGAVDFDDLIRLALELLSSDPEFLERLCIRYPYILEDEAQDSSVLQEQILRLLSGSGGNWVRVGDPNQAIFETFTTASPELLRRFIAENPHIDMPESGRSQPSILALANQLIHWSMTAHPVEACRSALAPPFIQPTSADDPQRNPPDDPAGIHLLKRKFSPEAELEHILHSLEKWLPSHPECTVAVLVPRNQRGADVIEACRKAGLDTLELLASTSRTRQTAGALNHMLAYLADPQAPGKLAQVYRVWRREQRSQGEFPALNRRTADLLRKCREPEAYLAPASGRDWQAAFPQVADDKNQDLRQELEAFRLAARRWLDSVSLPIDQLVLTLGADLFTDPSDLALTLKLALLLRQAVDDHPDWRLPELSTELALIARNERRFLGFSGEDSGFNPDAHPGRVVVTTMHKAKGLEWDRVHLMSVNNYDFPSGDPSDRFIAEKWFVRGRLNLEAEALAQLDSLQSGGEYSSYTEGQATRRARQDYARERLRLLYVGITRARRELILSTNTGRQGDISAALGLAALLGWWEQEKPA